MIELTEAQRQAVLQGEPVRLSLPDLGKEIVLVPAEVYEEMREILEDERQQKAFRRAGLRSATRWMKDNPF